MIERTGEGGDAVAASTSASRWADSSPFLINSARLASLKGKKQRFPAEQQLASELEIDVTNNEVISCTITKRICVSTLWYHVTKYNVIWPYSVPTKTKTHPLPDWLIMSRSSLKGNELVYALINLCSPIHSMRMSKNSCTQTSSPLLGEKVSTICCGESNQVPNSGPVCLP